MYVGENYEFKSLMCLSGNTITGNYLILGHTIINELECLVLKNEWSNKLEVATLEELKQAKI